MLLEDKKMLVEILNKKFLKNVMDWLHNQQMCDVDTPCWFWSNSYKINRITGELNLIGINLFFNEPSNDFPDYYIDLNTKKIYNAYNKENIKIGGYKNGDIIQIYNILYKLHDIEQAMEDLTVYLYDNAKEKEQRLNKIVINKTGVKK